MSGQRRASSRWSRPKRSWQPMEARPLQIALTDHVEAEAGTPASEIYGRVEHFVRLADRLGIDYFWFSEHHAHAHFGHLPTPLLFALHLAGRTEQIRLGA